jgi:hypothetical protein
MKLADLLATPPASLIKDADIESPDEAQLESDFASMAFVFLRDRAPGLMAYLLGFEVVDREEDGSRAVGIFGFKISGEYYYVPAFFVNQQVKGMDLLFSKKTNSFTPLRETWINHLLDKSTLQLGEGRNNKKLREDFENPNFDFLSEPPGTPKLASAGVNYLFTADELRKMGQIATPAQVQPMQPIQQPPAIPPALQTPQQAQPGAQPGQDPTAAGAAPAPQPAAGVIPTGNVASMQSSQLTTGNVTGQQPQFSGKAATDWHAGMGHEAWNALQGAVVESLAKDATLRMDLAGSIAAMQGETLDDWTKTADGSPLLDYVAQHGGPEAAATLMHSLGNIKFANAALLFYPSVESLYVHEFDASLAPVKQAATISVVATSDCDQPCAMPEDASDDERKRLVRDSFSIIDRRDADTKSEVFDAAYEKQYTTPTESGTYDLLLPTGSTAKAWVLHPAGNQPGKGVTVIEPTNRFYFTADAVRVYVRGQARDEDSAYDAAKKLSSMQPDERYVLVNERGDASAPFRVEAVVAENGERVRIRVNFESSVDHEKSRASTFDGICSPSVCYDDRTRYLQLSDDESPNLRTANENLIVSKAWKVLSLTGKYDYSDCAAETCGSDDYEERSAARSAASNAYDAFTPGDPIDLEEAFGKHAIHHMTVEAADHGQTYYAYFDGYTDGPWNRKQAMVQLVTKYGMSVDDAEDTMLDAQTHMKSRKLLKLAQGVGVGIQMPQAPGPQGAEESTGIPIEEPYAGSETGEFLGAPPLRDTMEAGYAVGGQTESEIGGGGDMGQEAVALADQAAQSGQKNVFDHATIGGLARLYDSSAVIDQYVPELVKALDRVGRILFIFYWKNEDFAERYGQEDLAEMEDLIRGVFKSFGDLVLKLKQKSLGSDDNKDVLAI